MSQAQANKILSRILDARLEAAKKIADKYIPRERVKLVPFAPFVPSIPAAVSGEYKRAHEKGKQFGMLLMCSEAWAHTRDIGAFRSMIFIIGVKSRAELRELCKFHDMTEFDVRNLLEGWKAIHK